LLERISWHEAGHVVAAITFGIPVISVTINDARNPHLLRGRYRPPHDAGLEALCVLCLSGPESERAFCGDIEPGADRTDLDMARRYLGHRLGPLQLAAEIERHRASAERLVRTEWARRRITVIAEALLAHGTLSGEDIAALG
jgi:hypothetical protein